MSVLVAEKFVRICPGYNDDSAAYYADLVNPRNREQVIEELNAASLRQLAAECLEAANELDRINSFGGLS